MADDLHPFSKSARMVLLLLWTLLPCLAIWVGMYVLGSALWAYGLYHGLCLMPAILYGRNLWKDSLKWPVRKEWVVLIVASVLFSLLTVLAYELIGHKLLSDEQALLLMKRQGWFGNLFWPISVYAVVVNPVLEELFWRGVVFNALGKVKWPIKHFAIIWSSISYAAFHYGIFRLILYPVYAEILTLGLAFYGAGLAVVYRRTGSIITIAAVHGLLTDMAAIMLMIDLFRRHPNFI
jgi:uncharacterized protein